MNVWFKADCNIALDAKLIAVGSGGFTLYMKGIAYSMMEGLDGVVPRESLPLLMVGVTEDVTCDTLCDRLVTQKLWEKCPQGFRIPFEKWCKHQKTKEQIETERANAAERKRKERSKLNSSQKGKKEPYDVTEMSHVTDPSCHSGVTVESHNREEKRREEPNNSLRSLLGGGAGEPETGNQKHETQVANETTQLPDSPSEKLGVRLSFEERARLALSRKSESGTGDDPAKPEPKIENGYAAPANLPVLPDVALEAAFEVVAPIECHELAQNSSVEKLNRFSKEILRREEGEIVTDSGFLVEVSLDDPFADWLVGEMRKNKKWKAGVVPEKVAAKVDQWRAECEGHMDWLRENLEEALSHDAAKKRTDGLAYLGGWIRRDMERMSKPKSTAGKYANSKPSVMDLHAESTRLLKEREAAKRAVEA